MKKQEWLKIVEVVDYLYKTTGLEKTRQTIYNWMANGKVCPDGSTVYLDAVSRLGQWYTTKKWVDNFIEKF